MKPLHLALGVFDGVHRGHRFLIGEAIQKARSLGHQSGVLTFHPHPKQVLHLPGAPQLIYPIAHRYWLLKHLGCDGVFIKNFTPSWSHVTPERFFSYLKRLFPQLAAIYVGEDFHFGHKRSGNVQTLEDLCQNDGHVTLHVIQRLPYQAAPICSSRIRHVLTAGDLSQAEIMLGQPYHSIGFVGPDNQFHQHCELKPKSGIYACHLKNKQGRIPVTIELVSGQFYLQQKLPQTFYQRASILEFQDRL